jgi:predicted dehydrogenase
MFAAAHAHSRLLMEAFMYRFHPQIALAKAIVDRGDIGALTHVRCAYSGRGREPDNPRYWKDAGGGALMDLGCYCVNLARMFAGGEPQRVRADAKFDKRTGVDMEFSATLEFANKIEAQLHCGFAANKPAYAAHVQGASGALEIPHPWQPPRWPAEISVIRGGKTQTIRVEDQRGPQHVLAPFAREIEHFTACVREGRRPTFPPDVDAERDSLGNMRAMDALLASARVLP